MPEPTLMPEEHSSFPLTQLTVYLAPGSSFTCQACLKRPPAVPAQAQASPAYSPASPAYSPAFISLDTVFHAVTEALPLGLETVRLSGADVLLYPALDALLDRLEELELAVFIETSGVGLTLERAKRLAALPRCSVAVGLDGADAATHDEIHAAPGSFDTAVRAVRLLAEVGLPPELVYTVRRRNIRQVARFIRLAETLEAELVRFNVPQPAMLKLHVLTASLGGSAGGEHHPGPERACTASWRDDELQVEELIALGRRIERELAPRTRLRVLFNQPPAFRGLYPRARVEEQDRCAVMHALSLLPGGEYALCGVGQNVGQLVFGRCAEVPLERVWRENRVLLRLRQGLPARLEGICARCAMKVTCLGSCVAENYLLRGSFWGPYWFCESAEKVGLFPAGRLEENIW